MILTSLFEDVVAASTASKVMDALLSRYAVVFVRLEGMMTERRRCG
jgi:hypothetical protein